MTRFSCNITFNCGNVDPGQGQGQVHLHTFFNVNLLLSTNQASNYYSLQFNLINLW